MAHIVEYTLCAVLLGVCAWLPGYALEGTLLRGRLPGELRQLARIVLGLVAWMLALFVLAVLGVLGPPAVGGVAASGALAAGVTRWRLAGDRAPGQSQGSARPRSTPGAILAWAVVGCFLAPFYLLALGPQVSWDADVYHLRLPRLFLEAGGFRSVPFSVYATWPLGTELYFAAAMATRDYVLAKLVHFGFGVLTLYAIAVGCRSGATRAGPAGALAALLFLANPVVLTEIHIAYVDLAVAFFFSSGFLFTCRVGFSATGSDEDRGPLLAMAGICAGAMAGLKVTGFVGGGVFGAMLLPGLLRGLRSGTGAAGLRQFGTAFLLPATLLLLPWLARAYAETGNPVYPLLYETFGGIDWSSTLAVQFSRWQDGIGMGRELFDYLLLPLRVILQGGVDYAHFDGQLGAFWVVALPFAVAWGVRVREARLALAAAGLYFVAWAVSSQQMRFLIPMLPLLCIATGIAFDRVLHAKLSVDSARRFGVAVVAVAALAVGFVQRGPMERGLRLGASYGSATHALRREAVPAIFRQIDTAAPADAVVLFLNTNRAFFSPRETLADSFFQASQIADWLRPASTVGELRELLDARGVTHVLFERQNWGIRFPPALRRLLADPRQARLVLRSADGRAEFYELRDAS